jgi:hypothetical protein
MVVDFITLCREYNRSFRHTVKRWRKGRSITTQDPADFDNYIPAMQSPTPMQFVSTPAVGLWENEVLVQTAQAFHGREMVRRLLPK